MRIKPAYMRESNHKQWLPYQSNTRINEASVYMGSSIEEKIVVSNELGLHARVATMIVQKMQNYSCNVSLMLHGVEVNARSVLGLLLLAASPGSEILVKAQGEGAQEAVEIIRKLVQDAQTYEKRT